MHPPRRSKAAERLGLSDRLADWLLTHCPFVTLTVLTLLVVGSSATISRLLLFLVPVVGADVAINLGRHLRRVKKGKAHHASAFHPGMTA